MESESMTTRVTTMPTDMAMMLATFQPPVFTEVVDWPSTDGMDGGRLLTGLAATERKRRVSAAASV